MRLHEVRRIGIQGGRGSFNDQALQTFIGGAPKIPITAQVEFLFTTARVLRALRDREVDAGQFAVHNSIDGPVKRSIEAMEYFHFANYFTEAARYTLPISHCLMIHAAAEPSQIDTIISHPTVFVQCQRTLKKAYPSVRLLAGDGDFEDPARSGEAIACGELPRNYAVLSSKRIAEVCGLTVISEELQDQNPNVSTFIIVMRKEELD